MSKMRNGTRKEICLVHPIGYRRLTISLRKEVQRGLKYGAPDRIKSLVPIMILL